MDSRLKTAGMTANIQTAKFLTPNLTGKEKKIVVNLKGFCVS
jgi:hypothetical protein